MEAAPAARGLMLKPQLRLQHHWPALRTHTHNTCRNRHAARLRRLTAVTGQDLGALVATTKSVVTLMAVGPFIPPMCFDAACQASADRAFLLAIALPLLGLFAWVRLLLRPVPKELKDSGSVFEDKTTGIVFGTPGGQAPERDKNGELAFRVVSFTPWPVEPGYEGDRIRLGVGPVGKTQLRTYVIPRILPQPSELVLVTLPRPLGVVLEFEETRKRVTVIELIPGSAAEQKSKVASLNRQLASEAVLPGDVLRAATCTNFVYPTRALFGAAPPERHIVVYSADDRKFTETCNALKMGKVKDGPVTLVLERRIPREDVAVTASGQAQMLSKNQAM